MSGENTAKKRDFQIWRIILLPLLLAIIPLIFPDVRSFLMSKQPQFILETPVVKKGDSVIYIFAENSAAKKKEALNIEIGGLEIKDGGILVQEAPLKWEFRFNEYELPRAILGEGLNTMSVSFAGGKSSNEMNFYINGDYFQDAIVSIDKVVTKGDDIEELEAVEDALTVVRVVSMSSDDDPRVKLSAEALRGEGLKNTIGYPNRIEHQERGITHDHSQIRIFNKKDKAAAEKLQKFYQDNFEIETEIKDLSEKLGNDPTISDLKKGEVEVWLK